MIKKIIITTAFLLFICAQIFTQQLTIGTYNLRNDNKGDIGNLWAQRAPIVANLLRFHQFDIFGIQEGFKNQLDDINSALPEYAHYGKGRDDGNEAGEHSSIFYRKDKFKLLKKGDFWLSETQTSQDWDGMQLAVTESAHGSICKT